MKKAYFVLAIPLAVIAMSAFSAMPAQAQVVPTVCPAGFTCTPVPCPAGYICTPTTPQPVGCPSGYICTVTGPVTPPTTCYVFSTNLYYHSTGPDVVALQTFLIANGFHIPLIENGSTPKGTIGMQTITALAAYQASIGVTETSQGIAYAGPRTRAALNASCPSTSAPYIVSSLDAASPLSSTIQISTTAQTQNVAMFVFDVRSQNGPSTVQSLSLNVKSATSISTLFTNIQIKVAGLTYSASSIDVVSGVATFTNLAIPLPANVNVPVTAYVTVAQDISNSLDGSTATISLPTYSITAIDSNYNSVPVTNSGVINGNTMIFTANSVQLSNTSAMRSPVTCDIIPSRCSQSTVFSFSLTAGNNPIFVSTAVTDTAFLTPNSSLVFNAKGLIVPTKRDFSSTNTGPGDTTGYFYIAPGQTRSFSYSGLVDSTICSVNSMPSSQIVAINYGLSAGNLSSNSIVNGLDSLKTVLDITCTGTTSAGQIVASMDANTPPASIVQISATTQTQNVALAVFDLKSQGAPATLQTLKLNVNTLGNNWKGSQPGTLFSNIQINVGSQRYSASSIDNTSGVVTFNNFSLPLPANTYVPVTVYGTVPQDTNGFFDGATAQVVLNANSTNVVALDSNYNNVSVNTASISGNTLTFTANGVQVSNTSTTIGTETCNSASNPTECDYPVSFNFNLTAGNSPIYIGKAIACPVGYGCVANPLQFSGDTTQIIIQNASVTPSTGDGSNYYYITPGQTRQFTYSGVITNSNNYSSVSTYKVWVSGISYGTSASNPSSNSITSGLSNLQVTVSFNGGGTTQPSIIVLSPTENTQWVVGNTYRINWQSTGLPPATMLSIGLSGGGNAEGFNKTIGLTDSNSSSMSYTVTAGDLPARTGFSWKVMIYAAGSYNGRHVTGISGNVYVSNGSGTTTPSIIVLSPNGGQTYQSGNTMYVSWNGGYGTDHVVIDLLQAIGNSYLPISGNYRIGLNNNPGSYSLTIPSVPTASNYVVGVGVLNTSTGVMTSYGYSGTFTINGASTSQAPTITALTAPSQLNVNQTGTWSLTVNDPTNGSLSYAVKWGDEVGGSIVPKVVQTTTYTHSYANPGTYAILFTVTNSAGLSAQTSATVQVVGPAPVVACPVGYICTPPNSTTFCPAGYICTAVTVNCPSGYTCYTYSKYPTPTTSPRPSPSSSPSPTPTPVPVTCPAGYVCVPPCPAGFTCTTPVCPAGYTCTTATVNCPPGYTCMNASKTPTPSPTPTRTTTPSPSPTPKPTLAPSNQTSSVSDAIWTALSACYNNPGSCIGF